MSTATIRRWQKRARKDPESEAGEFARRFDAARRVGKPAARLNLSRDDLVALLEERATQRRCLRSIQLLLTRPWERQDGERDEGHAPLEPRDEFADLDELAATPLDELSARRGPGGRP